MIDWSIALQPNSAQNALAAGWQVGTQMRQQREQEARQNALSAYASSPENPQAFNALAQAAPEVAIQMQAQRQQQSQAAREQDIRRRAASGDSEALAELAGIDLNAWRGLNADQQQEAQRTAAAVGQMAQYVGTLPKEQRAAAWDAQVMAMGQRNPQILQYQGQYSPELLQSTINEAGAFNEFWQRQQPQQFNIGPGEGRYERNPVTGEIVTRVVPNYGGAPAFSPVPKQGGAQQASPQPVPATGTIEDGYRFRGGDPADQRNWEPVMGASYPPTGPAETMTQAEVNALYGQYGRETIDRLLNAGRIVVRN